MPPSFDVSGRYIEQERRIVAERQWQRRDRGQVYIYRRGSGAAVAQIHYLRQLQVGPDLSKTKVSQLPSFSFLLRSVFFFFIFFAIVILYIPIQSQLSSFSSSPRPPPLKSPLHYSCHLNLLPLPPPRLPCQLNVLVLLHKAMIIAALRLQLSTIEKSIRRGFFERTQVRRGRRKRRAAKRERSRSKKRIYDKNRMRWRY